MNYTGFSYDAGDYSDLSGFTDAQLYDILSFGANAATKEQRQSVAAAARAEQESRNPTVVPTGHGMASSGRQVGVPAPASNPDPQGMTDEQLAALIAQFQQQFQQNQQPAVQPEMYTYQGAPQSGSQGGLSDTGINTPDYGQVAQRPAYNFSQQQQSQPMSVKQAQVNNFHNAAHSDWQGKQAEMQEGLLDMGQYRQKMGLLG